MCRQWELSRFEIYPSPQRGDSPETTASYVYLYPRPCNLYRLIGCVLFKAIPATYDVDAANMWQQPITEHVSQERIEAISWM